MPDQLPPYRSFLASDSEIREILRDYRSIAMIGLAADSEPAILDEVRALNLRGYRVLPVHPGQGELLGQRVHADLPSIPEPVGIVAVLASFRPLCEVALEAHRIGARVFWLEPGGGDAESAYEASKLGLQVVLNRTIIGEYEMHFPDDELGYPD